MTRLTSDTHDVSSCNLTLWWQQRAPYCNRRTITFANIELRQMGYFPHERAVS